MDKNIIALVRDDTKTVHVKFFPDKFDKSYLDQMLTGTESMVPADFKESDLKNCKAYTYVTTLDLVPGDLCIVLVGGTPKVVEVQQVDEDLQIPPNHDVAFKWITAKVDTSHAKQITAENTELAETLRGAYQQNMRRSFRDQLLGSVDDATKAKLLALTTSKKDAQDGNA